MPKALIVSVGLIASTARDLAAYERAGNGRLNLSALLQGAVDEKLHAARDLACEGFLDCVCVVTFDRVADCQCMDCAAHRVRIRAGRKAWNDDRPLAEPPPPPSGEYPNGRAPRT